MKFFARSNFDACAVMAMKRKRSDCQVSEKDIFVNLSRVKKNLMFGLQRAHVRQ